MDRRVKSTSTRILGALGAGSGDADSTLQHCEDLTEQELLHHLPPSLSLSLGAAHPLQDTVAIILASFFCSFLLRFLAWSCWVCFRRRR